MSAPPDDVNWQRSQTLGEGASGSVFVCYNNQACKVFSIKKEAQQEAAINKDLISKLTSDEITNHTLLTPNSGEVQYIDSKNIVTNTAQINNRAFIKYVLCKGTDLLGFVNQIETEIDEGNIVQSVNNFDSYYSQAKQFLSVLHSKEIYHYDIKPENLMICSNQLKFIDFSDKNSGGTPMYYPISLLTSVKLYTEYFNAHIFEQGEDGKYIRVHFIEHFVIPFVQYCTGTIITIGNVQSKFAILFPRKDEQTQTNANYRDIYALSVTFAYLAHYIRSIIFDRFSKGNDDNSVLGALAKIQSECYTTLKTYTVDITPISSFTSLSLPNSAYRVKVGGRAKYAQMTREVLYQLVKDKGIKGMSKKPKDELINSLKAADRRRARMS